MGYLEQIQSSTQRAKRRSGNMEELLGTLTRRQQQKQAAAVMQSMAAQTPTALSSSAPAVGAPAPAKASTPSPKRVTGGGVDSWIQQALDVLKLDSSYVPGIRKMIQKESSGNPRAVNNWDSNAKKGTPSKGLMQTIDPTFKAHALPGYDKDVFDPVSNIIAGVRYAQKRYGDQMLKNGGRRDSKGNYKGY